MQAKSRFNALNLSIYMIYVTKLKCLKGTLLVFLPFVIINSI